MKENITVDKAIKKGHLMVNVPVFIILIGFPALAIYLSKINLISTWFIGIAFLAGFVLAWIMWSYMITKWRIWAYENVRNVHELNKRAVQEKLIWKEGSFFEKTELRSNEDRIKLKKLKYKFERADEFKEDHSLPPKIEIGYSKRYIFIELGVSIFIIGLGGYFFIKGSTKHAVLGAIVAVIGLYGSIKEIRKLIHYKPQIFIDNKGIKTRGVAFKNWGMIENEEVIKESFGKDAKTFLTYEYDLDGFEKIQIDDLNVTRKAMENMLRTYRIRYNKNNPQ